MSVKCRRRLTDSPRLTGKISARDRCGSCKGEQFILGDDKIWLRGGQCVRAPTLQKAEFHRLGSGKRNRVLLCPLEHLEGFMEKDKEQIVETAVEARGGFLGRPVLLVLVVSVALAVAFMIFSYMGTPRP